MITQIIAEQALSYRFDQLPAEVVQFSKLAILDTVGCAVRGMREPCAIILADVIAGKAIPAADLLNLTRHIGSPAEAAQFFGTAAHAIDFDDGMPVGNAGHIGVGVVSAVLTLASRLDVSGRDMITAVVAGYETAARVSALMDEAHYARGFHTTSTTSSFGATAACCNLMQDRKSVV